MTLPTRFSAPTRAWFEASFAAPTPAQQGAWEAIERGGHTLVVAPTGSGKTLAAFLWSLDRTLTAAPVAPERRLRTLYVSPLKALAADIERNLRSPLAGITAAAERLGQHVNEVHVFLRTGDTPPEQRRRLSSAPHDVLITTPESLYLILTSSARDALRSVDTVIVDEIHSVAGNKRGAHLALSLERMDALLSQPAQRIGLSATVRPVEEVASFLASGRPVGIVAPAYEKQLDLRVVVPVEDLTDLAAEAEDVEGRTSVWPHVETRLLELIEAHRSTIVFANSRRLAERLCARLNELAGRQVARAHHGSVSREQRALIEEELKAGRLPAVVATSSLELGIDMGAVDLVVQVEAPPSVASGMQRIGRAGHQVGAVSRGAIFPKQRSDLLAAAVVTERMRAGAIEELSYPRNPLDVLAQQIVAMAAMDDWRVDDLEALVRRAAPFADLPRPALEATLDMLSGRYPSDEFAELRARINYDRLRGVISGRPGSQRLAVTSGGTIPDRGLFGVFMSGDRLVRVGELDEEMVYESRPGEVFVLGASSWLIEDITHDRVIVSPAPGRPGRMPFWHGDAPGRPFELGRALGAFVRELTAASAAERAGRLRAAGLDEFAAANLAAYIDEQRAVTGAVPDDRTIVIERFRDELGDPRLVVHTPFGARVHAPWAQAIEARVQAILGVEVQCAYTDDGIVVRLPDAELPRPRELVLAPAEEIEERVLQRVGSSPLFASRFRECAARALLLPRRRPGARTPLWQQRQRSAHLLQVAARYADFPILLETYRECLHDVFDLPALKELMAAVERREMRVVEVDTERPSPFASSLLFGFVSAFLYEGDAPLAERRAQALSIDRRLLAEIMGREELRELIDAHALQRLELELQRLSEERRIRSADDLHDALRLLGDLSEPEALARGAEISWLRRLVAERRALVVRVAGQERFIAAEDAARYRDGLGVALPPGLPAAFTDPVPDPLGDLVGRYARTHGPFPAHEAAARLGLGVAVVEGVLESLRAQRRVTAGELRPGGAGLEWVDVEVLRRLRRASLAAFRREVEAVAPEVLARFGCVWHGVARAALPAARTAGPDAVMAVIEQLQGVPIPASVLERQVLPARIPGYEPHLLDELGAAGAVVWTGAGALGSDDGYVVLALAEAAPYLLPLPAQAELSPPARVVLGALEKRGALFFRDIAAAVSSTDDGALLGALWELVWAGLVTNDTFAPLRALGSAKTRRAPPHRPRLPQRLGPPAGAGRWSLVPERAAEPTRCAHALAEQLLARHGIVTRGALAAERVPGGFAALYPVLKAFEESGRCRRGYFVEGLGGAQFALPGAVDRLRSLAKEVDREHRTYVLAATDPANPYGAALPWPERSGGARAGRKAGAIVVLVDGKLVIYVERGGRSLLSYSDDEDDIAPAVDALALAARDGLLGTLTLERADGAPVLDSPFARALEAAGFRPTSKGLRLRA